MFEVAGGARSQILSQSGFSRICCVTRVFQIIVIFSIDSEQPPSFGVLRGNSGKRAVKVKLGII